MKKVLSLILMLVSVCCIAIMNTSCAVKDKATQLFCEHVFDQGEVTKAATCKSVGELTKTCILCGKERIEDIERTPHIELYVESKKSTCSEKGHTDYVKCKVCDAVIVAPEEIPVLGHKFVEDAEVKATCLTPGLTKGEHCEECGEVFVAQEVINATGHSLVVIEGKEATCTSTGLTDGVVCANCGTVFTEQEELPIVDHSDYNKDFVCDFCPYTFEITEEDLINATEVDVVAGEKLAGSWYRIYNVNLLADPRKNGIFISSNVAIHYSTSDGYGFYISPSGEKIGWDDSYMIVKDEYLDVYIPLGLTFDFGGDAATLTITEDTTISLGENAIVKRLVFSV